MKNAVLIHGSCDKEEYLNPKYPSLSNSHWFPWLQKQLLINEIETQTPEMPRAYNPVYSDWKVLFEKFDVTENTILIGHSCGGGFLVRWLSENKVKVAKLVLVAPWLDPSNRRTDEFFDFAIDPSLYERVNEVHLFISNDEQTEGVLPSVDQILKELPNITVHRLDNKGHFTLGKMKTHEFPELLEVILR